MSGAPDVSRMSDKELMEYLHGGGSVQPVAKDTGEALAHAQAMTYAQLAAAGGIDQAAAPGSARLPRAQMSPNDQPQPGDYYVTPDGKVMQAPQASADQMMHDYFTRQMVGNMPIVGPLAQVSPDRIRAFARGVPVLGAWADEADAATAALTAPAVEPAMRFLGRHGIPTGYDERMRVDNGGGFANRFHGAEAMQNLMDANYDAAHPAESRAMRGAGTVLGTVAGTLGAPAYLPASSRLAAEAGLVPRMMAGAADGALTMGAQGYGEGYAPTIDDPSRLKTAEDYAAIGGAAGGAMPAAAKVAGVGYRATLGKMLDKAGGLRNPAPPTMGERLAQALRDSDEFGDLPAGLRPVPATNPDKVIAEVLAARSQVPPSAVPASAEDDAYARIMRAMSRQRQTPEQAAAQVQGLGPFGMLADSGEAMRNLTRDALNRPSGAEDIIRKALETRQRGVFDATAGDYTARPSSLRILDSAENNMGLAGRQYHSEFDALDAAQKAAADPLYAQVREMGATYSPRLQALEQRPSVQRAKVRAYRLAREDGRDPEALGLTDAEVPGAWDTAPPPSAAEAAAPGVRGPSRAPSRGASLAKFIADGGGLRDQGGDLAAMDAAQWNKGRAYQKPLIGNGASADDWALKAWEAGYFPNMTERPTERQLLDALSGELRGKPVYAREADARASDRLASRNAADEAAYRGPEAAPPEGYAGRPAPQTEPAWQAEPTLETWDYIKRGLDDELETYRDKTTGKLVLDGEGRKILGTLNELRGELVNLHPVYGKALDAYSGPAAMKDALGMGRDALSEDAPDLAKRFAEMTVGERQMYRLGALQALKDKLGNADVTFDAARRAGLLKPNQLERFKEMFPTREGFSAFVKNMESEQTMFDTRSRVLGNSTTAKQLLAAQENDDSVLKQALTAGLAAKTGHLGHVFNYLWTVGGAPKMGAPTAEALASILTNTDQSMLPSVTDKLLAAQRAEAMAEQLRKMSLTGASQAAPAALTAGRPRGQ
jgi:hypothetical protein